ncbi:MAG: hypothetical protein ABL958_03100 [Bdellovibrionia bacterium]
MKFLIPVLILASSAAQAGTVSCELIYAKNGKVQQVSGTMEVKDQGDDGKGLDLSIKNLVEATVFHGSNGKMIAHFDRIGGESNYAVTDGNLLHMTSENSTEGRALTCTYTK